MSGVWDGRLSIEHQIEIHINDLLQFRTVGQEVHDILVGLQYVMDYRIRVRNDCILDQTLCERLVRTLLLFTGERSNKRSILGKVDKSLSNNAEDAFVLLSEFCQYVEACRNALFAIPGDQLNERLCLHLRIIKPSESRVLDAAVALLSILDGYSSWRNYVDGEVVQNIEEILQFTKFYARKGSAVKVDATISIQPPPALYFDRETKSVLKMFGSSEETGLTSDAIAMLKEYYGDNKIPAAKERPKWRMLLTQFKDLMIMILIVTTVISAIVDFPHLESALVLGIVILLNVFVGFWQELQSLQTTKAMKSLQVPPALVRRNGQEFLICSTDLVPGDIVLLNEGDFVPADIRLISASRLEVQESILTGESTAVGKNAKTIKVHSSKLMITKCKGNVFMGTMVVRGTAVGIVVRIGANTEIGRIGMALANSADKEQPSELKNKLSNLGKILVFISIILCVAVAILGVLKGHSIEEMARIAISLAVSVIPEGLVAILTVAIALAIRRLAKRNALARKTNVVETLGAVSVAAADKTGTLTEGKMRLKGIWLPSSKKFGVNASFADNQILKYDTDAIDACILCNNATKEGAGEPTEAALFTGASKLGRVTLGSRLLEIPFDSERRMMSVAVQEGGLAFLFSKGAAEVILPRCIQYKPSIEGQLSPFTEDVYHKVAETVDYLSDQGLRVIALAKRVDCSIEQLNEAIRAAEVSFIEFDQKCEDIEKNLIFLGLACLYDPPREGVRESVSLCHSASIKVCMITGDHIKTAVAVAKEIGIFSLDDPTRSSVLHGRDLDLLNEEALASFDPFPCVFARVSPQNKLIIVRALQLRGEVVAMTGDGVNDAPAIRQAQVGVAMGKGGTEITRDAAALILLNDDFSVLTAAISQGRQVFHNIGLFIIYLLSCNSAEIWTVLVAIVAGWDAPLTPLNILWANIIADIPPSMCLALERQSIEVLMRRSPKEAVGQVMGRNSWILIAVNGIVLSLITLLVYRLDNDLPLGVRRSEAFLTLIGLQIFLALISRSAQQSLFQVGLLGNRWLIASVVLSFGLLIVGLYVPIFYEFLELQPVDGWAWLRFVIGALILVVFNEITKLTLRNTL